MLKRCAILWSDTQGYYVPLPTYSMIAGSWEPLTADVLHADGAFPGVKVADVLALNPSVMCELPALIMNADGSDVDPVKVKKLYAGHPVWGAADLQLQHEPKGAP